MARIISFGARRMRLLAVLLAIVAASGCGSREPVYYPVKGVVLIDGQPAASVDLTLAPRDGGDELARRGRTRTEKDGSFSVINATGVEGMPAGVYVVTFSKLIERTGRELAPGDKGEDIGVRELLPVRYSRMETSPESVTVKAPGVEVKFELRTP